MMRRIEQLGILVLCVIAIGRPAVAQTSPPSAAAIAGKGLDPLTSAPFDRITLIDGLVIAVEPVSPRPLPVYDPKKEIEKRLARREIPTGGNIGLPGEKNKLPSPEEDEADNRRATLIIHLLEGEIRDFSMKRTSLKSIEYYEEMLLAEGEKYVLARDYGRAWECYLKVQARDPNWKGLDEHVNGILLAEGGAALLEGDGERGLRLLRELTDRRPDYPGVSDKLAASYASRAMHAVELSFYALARKIVHDSQAVIPNHIALRAVRERLVVRARDLAASAEKLQGDARLDALTEALRIWPETEGADSAFREAFLAGPTLDVGVVDIPRAIGPWVRSPADLRVSRLLYRPVLAKDDEDSLQGRSAGQLASSLTTGDLGRRIEVALRRGVMWSDGSRAVSPIDVARSLTDMAEPTSPRYNARWADLLDRVETPDESHVEIRLTRPYLKPAYWLLGPVGPAHAAGDGRVATIEGGRLVVGDGPFRWGTPGRDQVLFIVSDAPKKANEAEPRPKLKRIREFRYPNAKAAVSAFLRGEVTVLEHLPPDRLAEFASNSDFKVGRDSRPSLHRIAVDGRNPALHNRTLRRGLCYAIDRRTLLEENLIHRSADGANGISDGAFPKGTYADAVDVKPYEYDPLLARMLVVAAKRELGGKPIKLTFEYPATSEAQAVAPKMIEALRATGLEIVGSERPESELEAELRAGRRFDLAYRASHCEEPVTEAGSLLSPAYDAPPATDPLASVASPRILQLLLQLERATDFASAKALVLQIDRESRDELPVIPLWQLEDHYAWRTRLNGPPEVTAGLYSGITSWEIEPWFAKDPW